MKRAKPDAGTLLEIHLAELGIDFIREWKFYSPRKWRADFMLSVPGKLEPILLEIEGAIWTQGRHTRGKGYLADLEKYRVAAALGFKVFRFSTSEVLDGTAKEFIREWA